MSGPLKEGPSTLKGEAERLSQREGADGCRSDRLKEGPSPKGGCLPNVGGCLPNVGGRLPNVGGCLPNVGCFPNVGGRLPKVGGRLGLLPKVAGESLGGLPKVGCLPKEGPKVGGTSPLRGSLKVGGPEGSHIDQMRLCN